MAQAPVLPRTRSQEPQSMHPGMNRVRSQDLENVQRSLIESAQKPVALHIRDEVPLSRRESPAMKMLSPRLDSSRVDARSPPRFERPNSPILHSKPNIVRLGSHRRVFSDDISFGEPPRGDTGRRASLGDSLKASPNPHTNPNPAMGRRSSLNDSLLRRQYSSPRQDNPRSGPMGHDALPHHRRHFSASAAVDVQKPVMTKSQSSDCVPRREYQVRIVKGPESSRSPARSDDGDSDKISDAMMAQERSVSPTDDSKKSSRVVVSIPETLIAKIQQALKEAGDEGLSCAQLMNTPSCKRLRFPCTLQGATPGSILRELPCVRHDNKRYYFVEPGSMPAASTEFSHRRLPSRAESLADYSLSTKLQYSIAELLEMRGVLREETEFDVSLKEKLFLLGLLPGGETDEDSSVKSRSGMEDYSHRSRGSNLSFSSPGPGFPSPPALTRKESVQSIAESVQSSGSSPMVPIPPLDVGASVETSSEVQEFTRMLQYYKTHNFCIDSAARVNESASALLTLLSKCGDIPQALYGPGVFPLVRRIYEKTKETPFWSDCRASVHQVITTALQLPQNSSSQQSWLMRFLLGCEASTEERTSNQASSSVWNTLNQEIMAEISLLTPGDSLRVRQQGAIERMGILGKTIKLGLQVFGPVAFGLASILSDVHLQTVGGPKTDAVKLLFSLLQESPQYKNVQMTRPGMIQCFDIESALSVTVCCHSRQEYKVASEMTALVLAYRSLDSRFELLYHMVSKWAQVWNLIDEVEGLSLWGWILLVVHYLQSIPSRILPVLDCFVPSSPSPFKTHTRRDSSPSIAASSILALAAQNNAPNSEAANGWTSTNTDCVGELLVGFFTRYAVEFNPETQCVSVRVGTFLDAADYRATLRALDPSFAPTPHPHISVASPAHVALAYSSQIPKNVDSAVAEPSKSESEGKSIQDASAPSQDTSSAPDSAPAPQTSEFQPQSENLVVKAQSEDVTQVAPSEDLTLKSPSVDLTEPQSAAVATNPQSENSLPESQTQEKSFTSATVPENTVAPGGAQDDSKSIETDGDEDSSNLPTESFDAKSENPVASSAQALAEMSLNHHRRTSSLSTISELAVPKSSTQTPASALRSVSHNTINTTRPKNCEHALCVEDPFRPTENVAMNTSRAALRRIQEALETARAALQAHAPLGQIFVVEEKLS